MHKFHNFFFEPFKNLTVILDMKNWTNVVVFFIYLCLVGCEPFLRVDLVSEGSPAEKAVSLNYWLIPKSGSII